MSGLGTEDQMLLEHRIMIICLDIWRKVSRTAAVWRQYPLLGNARAWWLSERVLLFPTRNLCDSVAVTRALWWLIIATHSIFSVCLWTELKMHHVVPSDILSFENLTMIIFYLFQVPWCFTLITSVFSNLRLSLFNISYVFPLTILLLPCSRCRFYFELSSSIWASTRLKRFS